MRTLIVNADDFGFTRDVNEGIVHAHRAGILTATTIMATGAAFDHAVNLARDNPDLDIGCHLVLVGGPGMPATVAELIRALALRRVSVYSQLNEQVDRILAAGIRPTHLDTHKHTHLLPPVLEAVARISQERQIRWVRRPFDLPIPAGGAAMKTRLANRAMSLIRPVFSGALRRRGCRATDHFAGFRLTGRFDARDLARLIGSLPPGITEFMCHPGFCTDELRAARTRLKESRRKELDALTDPEVRRALEAAGVRLATYAQLDARS